MKENTDDERIEREVETLIDGDRIIGFSDAVFAFAATLLVLKIDLPDIPPEALQTQFYSELWKLFPVYATNFISFLIIAYYWRLHHKLFVLIKRYDNKLIWMNTFVLIFVAFLPFPIDLFGEYSNIPPVMVFYTISIALVGFMLFALWAYAAHKHRLIDKKLSVRSIDYHAWTIAAAPIVFTLSIPLIFVDHAIAKVSWIFVLVALFSINKIYKKRKITNPEPV